MSALPAETDGGRVSAVQIADALRLSVSQAKRNASDGDWPYIEKPLPTGGKVRLYLVSSLPAEVRDRLLKRRAREAAPASPLSLPSPAELKGYQRERMEARAALLAHVDMLMTTLGASRGKAVEALVAAAAAGELPAELNKLVSVANARPNGERTLVRATVYNWLKARDAAAGDVVALAPRAVPEAPIPEWAGMLVERWGRPTNPNITEVLEDWPRGAPAPTYDQARRFIKRLDAITRNRGRMGPKALRSLKAYVTRGTENLWPGAVFVGDGHTFKRETAHPVHGRPFRPEITAIVDVYTRRWVGFSVALAENTWSVADALRHAVTTTTCCDIFYYDNGSGANNALWDADATGMAARLGITKLNSAPWSSQARGVIERFHSAVLHKLARRSPTYVGERMDDEARQRAYKLTRAEIRETGTSRILTSWSDLIAELTEAQAAHNDRPHDHLPKIIDPVTGKRRHMTPMEMWDRAIEAGWIPDPVGEAEATTLFRPTVERKVRRCLVSLFDNDYHAPELEGLHDEMVAVAYDIHDAGKVWVSLPNGRFVCEATWNGNKRDYVPIPFAERCREKRVEGKLKRIEAHRETALAELRPGSVVDSAPSAKPVLTDAQEARREVMVAEFRRPEAPAPDPKTIRLERARRIEAAIAAGGAVDADEATWLDGYRSTPEYRAARLLAEEFDTAAVS